MDKKKITMMSPDKISYWLQRVSICRTVEIDLKLVSGQHNVQGILRRTFQITKVSIEDETFEFTCKVKGVMSETEYTVSIRDVEGVERRIEKFYLFSLIGSEIKRLVKNYFGFNIRNFKTRLAVLPNREEDFISDLEG
jgi:hypothetical protein